MSYASKNLTKAYEEAYNINYNNDTKIVIMSDCHRGNGDNSDNFSKNQNIAFVALSYYNEKDFIYIEAGDGDELWEGSSQADIVEMYGSIFWMLSQFNKGNRLYMLFGNHDIAKKDSNFAKENYASYYDAAQNKYIPLFEDLKIHESVILNHIVSGDKIFVVHGHQADFFNNSLFWLSRFLVRYLWKPLEVIGVKNPTSAAKNYLKKESIEKHIIKWANTNRQIVIAGHTHRPYMPKAGENLYFNDGSCVHPRCITAIEIENNKISLVKWSVKTRYDAALYIRRDVLMGPVNIIDYYNVSKFTKTSVI
ncbi:MAG: metallophosphoesterase [Eubacteriaceae bacterium]